MTDNRVALLGKVIATCVVWIAIGVISTAAVIYGMACVATFALVVGIICTMAVFV